MSPVESNSRTWQGPKLPSRAFPCLQSAFQGLTLVFGGLSRTIPWILFHYLISVILQADFVLWNWLCYIETKSLVLQLMLFSCKIEIKFNHHFLCIDHLFRWLVIKLFSNFLLNIPFFFFKSLPSQTLVVSYLLEAYCYAPHPQQNSFVQGHIFDTLVFFRSVNSVTYAGHRALQCLTEQTSVPKFP